LKYCILIGILVVSTLSGCVNSFSYGGVAYGSREEAIRAADADIRQKTAGVTTADQRMGGSILVAIPTYDIILRNGVVTTGNASPQITGYIADVLELGFLGIVDAVRRGQIFDRLSLIRSPNPPAENDADFDYKLWLVGRSPQEWQWYFAKAGESRGDPITPDSGRLGSDRLASFNTAILKAASIARNSPTATTAREPARTAAITSMGTAFFVNGSGVAITNAHVVEGCYSLMSTLLDGTVAKTSVLAIDSENDLALLRVQNTSSVAAPFRISPVVRQGEQVIIYGYPLAGALASKGNLSIGIVSALAGLRDDTRKLQISAPIQPGNSGGPALDQAGNVIGVVTSKLNALAAAKLTGDIPQNVNFAIKSNLVTIFLESNQIDFAIGKGKKNFDPADIGDQAKSFTFRVTCGQ
jgi:S1-C subfamily serine protease